MGAQKQKGRRNARLRSRRARYDAPWRRKDTSRTQRSVTGEIKLCQDLFNLVHSISFPSLL